MNAALFKVIGSQVLVHATMAGVRLAAPLLALKQGYSAPAVGVLLALFALTQVFLALPAGRFADRHGLRRPFFIGMLMASIGCAAAMLFPVFPVLCFAALCTGGGSGIVVISVQRHVGRATHDPSQLKKLFSWLAIGPAFANFVGPFFTGLMIDHATFGDSPISGYRVAFGLLALSPIVAWFWIRKTAETPRTPAPAQPSGQRAWDLLNDPAFRTVLIVNWVQSASWDVHTFVLPLLGHERGMSASVIGTLLGVFAVAAAAIRLLMPLVADRLREGAVIAIAMAATACIFVAYPFMESALTMGICSMLLGFSLGSVQPMVMSMLHQITPQHRQGEALGLRLMVINASSVAMPMLFGAAGGVIGISALFWTVGAGVCCGVRPAWRMGTPAPVDDAPASGPPQLPR